MIRNPAMNPDRRRLLKASLTAVPGLAMSGCSEPAGRKIRVAVLTTVFRYRSHCHVILENFLVPYLFNGRKIDPTIEFEIVSFYVDQFPPPTADAPDMARDIAAQFRIPIFPDIAGALTLGSGTLAVDAVLLIAEHGSYPHNEKGQELYPKKRFFGEMTAVFEASGRSVPVYSDKHLSHDWKEASEMVETSRRLKFGLMAGSSVPLAQRIPPLDLAPGQIGASAVSIHGGPMERFGFHGLEILLSMIEARPGGETGVKSVEYREGDALWQSIDESLASETLRAEFGSSAPALRELANQSEPKDDPPHAFVVHFRDGFSAQVIKLGTSGTRWLFGCQDKGGGSPHSTRFHVGPWNNRNLFKALAHGIQHHFRTGTPPGPIERTWLVGGILEAALDSRAAGGTEIATPHLDVAYQARDFRAFREMGDSWKIITEETPQPQGIEAVGV